MGDLLGRLVRRRASHEGPGHRRRRAASARSLTVGLEDRGHEVVGLRPGPGAGRDATSPGTPATARTPTRWPRSSPASRSRSRRVVHLAGHPDEGSLPDSFTSHVVTTAALLDAMVEHGVRRFVYAGSNHAVGRTPRPADGLITVDAPAAARHLLRRRQGGRRGGDEPLRRPLRHRRRLLPDRLVPARAPERAPAVDLAVARRLRADGRGRAHHAGARATPSSTASRTTPAPGGTSRRVASSATSLRTTRRRSRRRSPSRPEDEVEARLRRWPVRDRGVLPAGARPLVDQRGQTDARRARARRR